MQTPLWITSFLRKTFFTPCSDHEKKKNDLNYYCIDCDLSLCKYCISTNPHNQHNFLQMYKYSYQDSIRTEDMKEHIDCSEIQPYRLNRQKVFVLNPLPSSSSRTEEDNCCNICRRKLIDANQYSYCSIACKIEACLRESHNPESAFQTLEAPPAAAAAARQSTQLRRSGSGRRKGIPKRAPRN